MALVDDVVRVFEKELPRVLGSVHEPRRQQVDMACAVADAITNDRVVVAEAETGLGKSLAYLIPVMLHCRDTGERAVIATYTKTLQRQLTDKDIVLAQRACGGDILAATLMGRANYACRRAVNRRLSEKGENPEREAWLSGLLADETGDLEAVPDASLYLDVGVRAALACPSREAICSGCSLRDSCFLFSARRRALGAQVVVTNHALLFSNLAADGVLLGPYQALVCDEAHHLDDVATSFLTVSYGPRAVRGAHDSIYSPEYEEMAAFARERVGASSTEDADTLSGAWRAFHGAMAEADVGTGRLLEAIGDAARTDAARDRASAETRQIAYGEGAPLLYNAASAAEETCDAIARMAANAGRIESIVRAHVDDGDTDVAGTFRTIADVALQRADELRFVCEAKDEDYVFYATLEGDERVSALSAAPVDVGPRLGAVFDDGPVVLTSATLAVGDDFSFTLNRVGLVGSDRVVTRRYDTPFDLVANRRVVVVSDVPDPSSREFVDAAAVVITDVLQAGRRMLVLATSFRQARALSDRLTQDGRLAERVFVQTDGSARGDLLSRFTRTRGAALIGLASFWEGIDLPGDALEVVTILKLPFLVPTQPVVSARAARLSTAGENPFERLFVPDVVLKLRQGMGRLIRTGSDRGAVILLDRRLVTAPYGAAVLGAVTDEFVHCCTGSAIAETIGAVFDDAA